MKKILVLTLVLALLTVAIVPAFAAGDSVLVAGNGNGDSAGRRGGVFALAGTITAINSATGAVDVAVACGNKVVAPYIGQTASVQTTAATRFLQYNPDGTAVIISFADLAVGQTVSANGQLANGVLTASRMTVGASLSCTP